MTLDLYASQPHYLDHLLPIWAALPDDVVGDVLVEGQARKHPLWELGALTKWKGGRVQAPKRVLVAGQADVHTMRRAGYGVALVEHGAGQSYVDQPGHPSYPGGLRREGVGLFLCTNESVAERNRKVNPHRSVVCGCPRLDDLAQQRAERPSGPHALTLALVWHWPCTVAAESYWLLPEFKGALPDLVARWPGKVIGHAHPKARQAPDIYRAAGVEWVPRFDEVVQRADVVSFDNTSAGLEAAALGIPVVLCESPRWRRNVEHGLRFWKWADIGPTVRADTYAKELAYRWVNAATIALDCWRDFEPARRAMAAEVYPHRGEATRLAVDALLRWVGYEGSATE